MKKEANLLLPIEIEKPTSLPTPPLTTPPPTPSIPIPSLKGGGKMRIEKEIDHKIDEAKKSGRYYITISYLTKENDTQYYWVTQNYPKDDILPTLDHLRADIEKKELSKTEKWK